MDFSEIFYYDESSKSCLRWKINIYFGRNHSRLRIAAGEACGTRNAIKGHWSVGYSHKYFPVHRVVWELFYGKIPKGFFIDHLNQDSSDNRIGNLRIVSNAVNKRNSGKYSNNSSGVTGVRKVKMRKNWYWQAHWAGVSKRTTKNYNINTHGEEKAFELACIARKEQISNLNSVGYGYSENHGLECSKAVQRLKPSGLHNQTKDHLIENSLEDIL